MKKIKLLLLISILIPSCTSYSSKVVLPREKSSYIMILDDIDIQDVLGISISKRFQRSLLLQNAQSYFDGEVYDSEISDDNFESENKEYYAFHINMSFYEKENLISGSIQYDIIGFLVLLDSEKNPVIKISHAQNYPTPISSPNSLLHISRRLFYLLKQQKKDIRDFVSENFSSVDK